LKILYIGDTVATAGRTIVRTCLRELQEEHAVDFIILNCENAAPGNGVTPQMADQFFDWGVDVLTSGNHIWNKKEILPYLNTQRRLLRPANYPPGNPGRGVVVVKTKSEEQVAVINLQGRVYMPPTDDPFRVARSARCEQHPQRVIAVHTGEFKAFAWHIGTVKQRLPKGCAFHRPNARQIL
jgi:calcineurin-like phosphoesterase